MLPRIMPLWSIKAGFLSLAIPPQTPRLNFLMLGVLKYFNLPAMPTWWLPRGQVDLNDGVLTELPSLWINLKVKADSSQARVLSQEDLYGVESPLLPQISASSNDQASPTGHLSENSTV